MIDALTAFAAWIGGLIVQLAQFLIDVLLYIPRQIFSLFVDGGVAFFQAIPAPGFVADTASAAASIASSVVYFLDLGRADVALSVFAASAALRFLIRRIPVIG